MERNVCTIVIYVSTDCRWLGANSWLKTLSRGPGAVLTAHLFPLSLVLPAECKAVAFAVHIMNKSAHNLEPSPLTNDWSAGKTFASHLFAHIPNTQLLGFQLFLHPSPSNCLSPLDRPSPCTDVEVKIVFFFHLSFNGISSHFNQSHRITSWSKWHQ